MIVLGFNDTSTLVHFVFSPREREKRDRRDSRGEEQVRKRNRNESEETEKIRISPSTLTCYKDSRPCQTVSQYQLDTPVKKDTRHLRCSAPPDHPQGTAGSSIRTGSEEIHYAGSMPFWVTGRRLKSLMVRNQSILVTAGIPQSSALGPILILIYINDLPEELTSKVRLFTDDTAVYLTVGGTDDSNVSQQDLDKLMVWESKWDMFNPSKCQVVRVTTSRKSVSFPYKLQMAMSWRLSPVQDTWELTYAEVYPGIPT